MERGAGLFAGLQMQVGDALRNGSEQAVVYAERILARLDRIAVAVETQANPESERTIGFAALDANTSEKIVDGRAGYMMQIEHIAIIADAATDVDIFVGTEGDTGFRLRYTFATADRDHNGPMELDVPENAPIIVRTGAGAVRVNMQVRRQKVVPAP